MNMKNQLVKELVAKMSLEEKIGLTMTVISEGGTYTPANKALLQDYHCGGLRVVPATRYNQKLFIDRKKREAGQSSLERFYLSSSFKNPVDITLPQFAGTLQRYHQEASEGRNGIPLRIAYDQEGGLSRDLTFGGAHIFPPPMGLAASGDPGIAYEAAKVIGRLGRAVGLNMIHSPVLDVNVEPNNPEIYTRSYSDIPEVVAEFAMASARGFKEVGMIAVGKHFPGRGDCTGDAHFEIPVLDIPWDTLWNRDLYPYRVLLEENLLPAVMTAHSIYPAVDPDEIATLSERMLQGVLRDKLGFEGVITTDAIGMMGVTLKHEIPDAYVKALQAGCDMVLMRTSTEEPVGTVIPKTIAKVTRAIESGILKEEELDAKVYRILNAYDEAGLIGNYFTSDESIEDVLKDPHCIDITKTASELSVRIVRDREHLLPLKANQRALVIEQRVPRQFCPNNGHWYSGMFYDFLCEFSDELSYIETDMKATPEQEELVMQHLDSFELVIMTCWYYRDQIGSNTDLVRKIARCGKHLIVVGDTPYESFSIPPEPGTALVQFGITPTNIRVVAEVLFGKREAKAGWPLAYRINDRVQESAVKGVKA
jgi:beta-N-acetylhexosaminidase